MEFVEGLDEPEPLAPQTPENLIVIMNESFADMQASFPQLELSEDPLTFFHSLKENTIRGTILSPVSGGGTANVEYEFLTGGSLAFLPAGTVAYQLFAYDGLPSLSSQLKDAGYYNVAFHPYLSSGWNRTSVYKWLKFDRQLYDEDVKDPYIIREYISDFSDYEQLYQLTEEIDQPTFIFNVTMQNHSGYSQGWNNLGKTVRVTGGAKNTYPAIQYFSLMKESDRALQELIEHYSASDERTMVVFFGDHQPPLGTDFYKDLYGNGGNGLILQPQSLPAAGKFQVIFGGAAIQLVQVVGPVADQNRPHLSHAQVELRQGVRQRGKLPPVLQNPALVVQQLVVLGQGLLIAGPQLAQGVVQKPPPLRCAGFQHQQILRAEQHRGQQALEFGKGLLLHAAQIQLPGPASGEQHRPQGLLPVLGKNFRLQIGKLRPELQQLRFLPGAEPTARGQIHNGLQQIGLALGIVTQNQVDPGDKVGIQTGIVAEALQTQMIKSHLR